MTLLHILCVFEEQHNITEIPEVTMNSRAKEYIGPYCGQEF